jgi:hypothetical protein
VAAAAHGRLHGARLPARTARQAALAAVRGEKPRAVPVDEPLATLDRCTNEGLTTGRVTLPGRSMHVGEWFRLLRSLLDEVSLALTTPKRRRQNHTGAHLAGHRPPRACGRSGLNV